MKLTNAMLAIAILTATPAAAAAQTATIENIRVQLFYEYDGTLSDDLVKRKDMALWNVFGGGGDVEQPADSFLISVAVRGQPKTFDKAAALTITVTDDKRKAKVAEKTFNNILFGAKGVVVKPLFVADRVCNPLTVTAKLKSGSTKSVKIPFHCGE